MTQYPRDLTAGIIAFEQGEMDREEIVDLFQHLIDTGLVWKLQGFYGRTARDLIAEGYCTSASIETRPPVEDASESDADRRSWGTQQWAETHSDDLGESPDF